MRFGVLYLVLAVLLGPASVAFGQSTPPAGSFQQAVERTTLLKAFRATLLIRARGTAADPLATTPPSDERVVTEFSAIYNGADSALTYRSTDAAANGYDPQLGLQLVVARGVTYAAGPLPVSGATEQRWYNFGRRPPAALQPPVEPAAELIALTETVDVTKLSRTRFEQLDGRSCAVYSGNEEAAIAALARYGRPIGNNPGVSLEQQLSAARLERAEYRVWLCNDGYIRQIRVGAGGASGGRGALPFAIDIQLRIADIGSRALRVPVPGGALVLRSFPLASLTVSAANALRAAPSVDAPEVGQVLARESVQLLDRSADGRWYRVRGTRATGWLVATALPQAAARARLPIGGQGNVVAPVPTPAGTPGTSTPTPSGTAQPTPTP